MSATDLEMLAHEGSEMSADEARAVEAHVENAPTDAEARARLVGFYFFNRDEPRTRYVEHAAWFVKHMPGSSLAGAHYLSGDDELTAVLQPIWEEHLRAAPNDAALKTHAAVFFATFDPARAEQLYVEASQLEPERPDWYDDLANLLELRIEGPGELADRAFTLRERAHALTQRPTSRFYQLTGLAEAAFAAEKLEAATRYAEEALRQAPLFPRDWNFGNAIYRGNHVLGRIELRAGRVDAAKQRLLAASMTPGSPQLDSFGPPFELAKELGDRGELKVIATWLENIGRFWKMGAGPLERWKTEVAAGRAPDYDERFGHMMSGD